MRTERRAQLGRRAEEAAWRVLKVADPCASFCQRYGCAFARVRPLEGDLEEILDKWGGGVERAREIVRHRKLWEYATARIGGADERERNLRADDARLCGCDDARCEEQYTRHA